MTDLGASLELAKQRANQAARVGHAMGFCLSDMASFYEVGDMSGVINRLELLRDFVTEYQTKIEALKKAHDVINVALAGNQGVA